MEKLQLTEGWLDRNITSAKEALEATPELVSRLRAEVEKWKKIAISHAEDGEDTIEQWNADRAELSHLRQQLEVARKALAPVVQDYASYIGAWTTGGEETLRQDETRYSIKGSFLFALLETYNNLRAAASAYEALTEAGKCKDGE